MRCKARARSTGEQCKRKAIEGLTVCRSHGGATRKGLAKSARVKAEAKAAQVVRQVVSLPPACEALLEVPQTPGRRHHGTRPHHQRDPSR